MYICFSTIGFVLKTKYDQKKLESIKTNNLQGTC